ncbi:PREDICTED: exocyst complex component 8 [Nicrophorus vespilloides]|uniref:Exocyst complex component 8 n=1 Tax=Nicrophorus vespilloides TaxID=110193 RepID=A0ABM1ND58_NICVS|nr:PREDICTED: exocyst complex component 8 [Nicrophorus vespilloides]
MADPSISLLSSTDFNPDKYVKELSQSCVGGQELIRLRKTIHGLYETTNENLKRNVYKNYIQFIDTAKEISHLESEMYQLSHLLTEQRSLLNSLYNTSILGDDTTVAVEAESNEENSEERDEEIRRQKIACVLEKVEGCASILDVPNIILQHEGFLSELDVAENIPIKNVYAFLFSEGLLLAISNNVNSGKRYKHEAYYELGSLAVVNVRDLGNVKHAFKLLAFPDTRVFQCKSNSSKKDWLDKFEQAKKLRLAHDQQKRETICEKSPSRSISIESSTLNPFDDQEEEENHPDWLLDIPEELDVCVAQRHFEEALVLLQKAKDYIMQYISSNNQSDHILADIQRKVEQRNVLLTEVLMKELEVNPDKSLQGGLRAARRAVRLLNQLGRSTQSCGLFLKLCSSMLKTQCKRVKREGSTTVYVRYLSSVVFTNMCHMTEEFLRAFPDSPNCASAYVVWASNELNLFSAHFIKQAFMPQTPLSVLTECVVLVRLQCERLCSYGIDLCYQLDGALRTPLSRALKDTRDKFIDAIKVRSLDDKWIPLNLKSKMGLARFLQENNEMGLILDSYVTGDCWLQLTANTMAFTKLYLALIEDCLKLQTSDLLYSIDETLYTVFDAHLRHIEQSLRKESQYEQRKFITNNADFLLNTLLSLVQTKYSDVNQFECAKLSKLKKEYTALLQGVSPTNRNIKYSSTEYL